MEQLRILLLGIVLGGVVTYYWLNEDSPRKVEKVIIECQKERSAKMLFREEKRENGIIQEKEEKSVQQEKKIKTPDELYEEQERAIEESELEEEVFVEVDRSVVSLEMEQAENEISPQNVPIDETIVPKELQEAELNNEEEEVDSGENLPLQPLIPNEELEIKEVISERLLESESSNEDEESVSDEDEIPK